MARGLGTPALEHVVSNRMILFPRGQKMILRGRKKDITMVVTFGRTQVPKHKQICSILVVIVGGIIRSEKKKKKVLKGFVRRTIKKKD